MGNITVKGLRFFAFHGVYPEERETGGPFEVDISVESPFSNELLTDDVKDAIDYVALMDIAGAQMKISRKLIEVVAHSIGTEVKKRFPGSEKVEVSVRKMAAPVPYDHEYVSATVVIE